MDWKLGGLGLLMALACGDACAQYFTDEVDRSTGQREIAYTSGTKMEFGVPHVGLFANQGERPPVSGVRFMISPERGRYGVQVMQYIDCKQINWLVNGSQMELGMVVHSYDRIGRVVVEFLNQDASPDQLAAIGAAETVEYEICGTEGRFSAEDIATAAEIARRLRSGTASAPSTLPSASEPPQSPPAAAPTPAASGMKYRPKLR